MTKIPNLKKVKITLYYSKIVFCNKAKCRGRVVLEVLEHDYGEDALVLIVMTTARRLGHSLGLCTPTLLRSLWPEAVS